MSLELPFPDSQLREHGPGMRLITSLELHLDLELFPRKPNADDHEKTTFLNLLETLESGALPALKNLEIIFKENLYTSNVHPWRNMAIIRGYLLTPLLETGKHLNLISVAVPLEFYKSLSRGFTEDLEKDLPSPHERPQIPSSRNQRMRYPYTYNWNDDDESQGEWFWLQCGVVSEQYWEDEDTL